MNGLLVALLLGFATPQEPANSDRHAFGQAPSAQVRELLKAGVMTRLVERLATIPNRWEALPRSRVPRSGRLPVEVLSLSSAKEKKDALAFISTLASTPLREREALILRSLEERRPTEAQLWWPAMLVQDQQLRNLEDAALTLEAWLMWLEKLGRRDALFFAGTMGLHLADLRPNPKVLMPIFRSWVSLPETEETKAGIAQIHRAYAATLTRAGEMEQALSSYRKARRIFQEIGDQQGQGNALNGEAEILVNSGETRKALETYRKARKFFRSVGEKVGEANTLNGEAEALFQLGKSEEALDAYRKARELYTEVGSLTGEGNTYLGESEVLLRLGENAWAIESHQKARKIYQTIGDPTGIGYTYTGEARALLRLGNAEEALKTYRKARSIFENLDDEIGLGNALDGEGEALFRLGEFREALAAYRQARRRFQSFGNQQGEGNTFDGEAEVLLRMGEYERAAEAAARASKLFLEAETGLNRIAALLLEGRARQRLKDGEGAIHLAEEVLRLASVHRREFVAEQHRTWFDETISEAYTLLVPLLTLHGTPDEALSRAEEARSHVLLDLITDQRFSDENMHRDLQRENKRLRADLARLETKLHQESDPAHHQRLLAERDSLDTQLQRNLYRQASAGQRNLLLGKPLTADAIRSLADEIGPILLYFTTTSDFIVFLVTPSSNETQVHRAAIDWQDLEELADTFLHEVSNPMKERQAHRHASTLWHKFIAPFADQLPLDGPLTVVPHGPLHGIPFELLVDPATGDHLFNRWDMTVTPSVSVLALARGRHSPPSQNDQLVAFAGNFGASLSQTGISEVAKLFPTSKQKIFSAAQSEFHAYESFASRAHHLLIATHGVHVQGSRRGTYLQIQPTPGVHDGRLTVAEIATISLNAELVTLAACDTDRGEALFSDERLTLTRSFLIAGATSVLATRWRIPEDRRTTRFLVDFYQAYRQGGPEGEGMRKDEALSWARRKSVERGDPAQVWAAWVLVGDAR